jgi:hypothetical protein
MVRGGPRRVYPEEMPVDIQEVADLTSMAQELGKLIDNYVKTNVNSHR